MSFVNSYIDGSGGTRIAYTSMSKAPNVVRLLDVTTIDRAKGRAVHNPEAALPSLMKAVVVSHEGEALRKCSPTVLLHVVSGSTKWH